MRERRAFTDTHVHFHDLRQPGLRWEWLEPGSPDHADELGDYAAVKAVCYTAQHFLAETRFSGLARVVHVQAAVGTRDPVEETRWLQATADAHGVPHAIVGHADLARPDVAAVLAGHAEHERFRGIRDLRDDDYLGSADWQRGLAEVERRRLVLCWMPPVDRMREAALLARRFAGVTFCVDHAGYQRDRSPDGFRAWREGMAALAEASNTVVKISGFGMVDNRWTVESIRPWARTCIDLFGPERAFFGTNWPLDRLFSSYPDLVDAYAEVISDLAQAEQDALFQATANRIFGLDRR